MNRQPRSVGHAIALLATITACVSCYEDSELESSDLRAPLGTTPADHAVAVRFAPLVNLHPQDRFRPADAGAYFASATQLPDATLRVPDTWWNVRGESVDGGVSHAPAYYRIAQHQGRTYLQYYFFYGTNGCQGFMAGTGTIFTPGNRNFDWCSFAYHEADWEHITVKLAPDRGSIERVHFAAHGHHGRWYGPEEMSFHGSHPVVYSALNSHASYPSDRYPFDVVVAEELPIALPAFIRWLKTGDIVGKDVKLDTYEHQPFSDYVRWYTWDRLVDIDDWSSPGWAWYWGAWGERRTNGAEGAPGSLPGDVRAILSAGAAIANAVGALDRYRSGDPPWGPRYQGPWESFDDPPPTVEACFHADGDHAGDRLCLGQGDTAFVGGDWNDRFSSLRLHGGATVEVFRDAGFGGGGATITTDVASLGGLGWNDAISSVRVRPPATQACFYTDSHYRGTRVCISTGVIGLVAWDHNDVFSSVRLYGTTAELFEHADYQGQSRRLTGDVADLGELGFNDVVSSLRISPAPEVCFFTDSQFRGTRVCYGLGDVRSVGGDWNDQFSSVQLRGGAVVQLYADDDYGGDTRYFTSDIADLPAHGFNDTASSFKAW